MFDYAISADSERVVYRAYQDTDDVWELYGVVSCLTEILVSNQTMSGTQVFRSLNSLTVGPDTTVSSGAGITLRSRTIRLEPGVSTQLGATFTANTDLGTCGTEVDEVLAKDREFVFVPGDAAHDAEVWLERQQDCLIEPIAPDIARVY